MANIKDWCALIRMRVHPPVDLPNHLCRLPVRRLDPVGAAGILGDDADLLGDLVEPDALDDERVVEPQDVVVWERLDGRKEVITGRHRLELAQRMGEATIPAQVVREADGFTKEKAMSFDAEANIRDGQGSARDYASYFRHSGISLSEASSRGLLARDKGRAGLAIGRGSADGLYALWRNGRITDEKARVIAEEAPGSEALQALGIQKAPEMPANELRNHLKVVQQMEGGGGSSRQIDMFGRDDSALVEAGQIAKQALGERAGWENWSTDPAKYQELRRRAGLPFDQAIIDAGRSGTAAATPEDLGPMLFHVDDRHVEAVKKALQEIAAGREESLVPNLRPDLEAFGGSSDVFFVWGDSRKGLAHIIEKRGIQVAHDVIATVMTGKIDRFVEGKKTVHLVRGGPVPRRERKQEDLAADWLEKKMSPMRSARGPGPQGLGQGAARIRRGQPAGHQGRRQGHPRPARGDLGRLAPASA